MSCAIVKDQLEYLAVYGRASMAAFCQLSTHGQKFDPESFETLHPYLVNKYQF